MSENETAETKMPSRFTPLAVSGQQNWIVKGPDVIVQGILKGRFKRSKGKQFFYQVQLTIDGVQAIFDGDEVEIGKKDVVCIDETKALEPLAACAEDKENTYEVYIRYVEKVSNPSDPSTSFWRCEVGAEKLDGDQIPF